MNVEHRLPGAHSAVEDQTKARHFKIVFFGQEFGDSEHRPHQILVRFLDFHEGAHMFFGNDQKMDWRLGIDILDGDEMIILVNDFRGFVPLAILQNRQFSTATSLKMNVQETSHNS